MPESSLALAVQDLWAEVGIYCGHGAGSATQTGHADTAWTAREFDKIKSFVKSGLRRFYFPTIGQSGVSHSWTFLSPTATVTLESGARTVALPDDFGGLEGQITLATSGNIGKGLEIVGVPQIDQWHAERENSSGAPSAVAIRPKKGTTGERGQRQELYVFPEADAAYTFQLNYYLLPGCLDGNHPYAYGGAKHAETILESCLAVAEERNDDIANGPHALAFARCLAASISQDRMTAPHVLGNLRDSVRDQMVERQITVTFNGTQY